MAKAATILACKLSEKDIIRRLKQPSILLLGPLKRVYFGGFVINIDFR
jgi:hypothetical protein